MKTILAIAGTRPELIKLAPLIYQLRLTGTDIVVKTAFSGQHVEILESVLHDFDVTPDVDLRGPLVSRSLAQNLAHLVEDLDGTIAAIQPDGVIVQGDTTTALAGALAAFSRHVPVFHVEAGLRTSDPELPFPEEMNRRLISRLAVLHFAPTAGARENLLREGIDPSAIAVTGNTGVDSLRLFLRQPNAEAARLLAECDPRKRQILVTLHRRENLDRVSSVATAMRRLVLARTDVEVLWVLHRNGTREAVLRELGGHPSISLLEPVGYHTFVHVMAHVHVILTDSGGIQEEAPYLGKPLLVLRDQTERPEAVAAGSARLVGCDTSKVLAECSRLLDDQEAYRAMSRPAEPFGDGRSSERIVQHLEMYFGVASTRCSA